MKPTLNQYQYTPPTSPFPPSRHRARTTDAAVINTEDETESENEDTTTTTTPPNNVFNYLLQAIDLEKKFEVSRQEIEAGKCLNFERKRALVEWENGLKLREIMLHQKERNVEAILQLRENNLKHRENSVAFRDVMLSNRRIRLDIVKNNQDIIAKAQQNRK